ncbi:PREDICTED: kyphoscoliosis peptidase-like [Priapulus caudatus]|uniref:Kyphoscoliosis peptidase-like n=1 Tax=Priapulus caudatus TaxID=37621 RepID=A0ABM1E8Z4_PRICU|nr:PREDICTED: kyphoscoliosis peptidase-like [Priapulus caudatus]
MAATSSYFNPMVSNPEFELCTRCGNKVYRVDRVGPLKSAFFHKSCLKCVSCNTQLTLKTYIHNQLDPEDSGVYCNNHVPRTLAGHMDGSSFGIRAALNVPKRDDKINEQIRSPMGERGHFNADAVGIRQAMMAPKAWYMLQKATENSENYLPGHFDSQALHIQHPMQQQAQMGKVPTYNRVGEVQETPLPLDEQTQVNMEMQHRTEEDELFRIFQKQREEKSQQVKQQIDVEWQLELQRLTQNYDEEMRRRNVPPEEQKQMTIRHQHERKNLEEFMTLKRDKAKRDVLRKMLEHERDLTTDMVDKHAEEMLDLINNKKLEIQYQQEELTKMQNLSVSDAGQGGAGGAARVQMNGTSRDRAHSSYTAAKPPPPRPPIGSKADLYNDPAVFEALDQQAISVAQENQSTFTELVRQLIQNCVTDVEKARAIFRWITVKNLNTMEFEEQDVNADTPMGLLRGIKYGTESYHVLFKRLCSYAGMHCVVIRGYSKSAGYLPGMKFEDKRFRNTWNAVFLDGSWRFVQCNWGARHLVNAKDAPKPGEKGGVDNLRYEYDDHYFLTDPEQFIYEFFPKQKEWQLLRAPVSLDQFEKLPFVRSLFFKYGLKFSEEAQTAVMTADKTGAVTLNVLMPPYLVSHLVFHYNLRMLDSERDEHDGVNMRRYVMQTLVGNSVVFKVHAPTVGAYILDVFANLVSAGEYMTGQPMRFKSVCKMKVICERLERCMVPLPNCASGEWGPLKAYKLFGLIPMTHEDAVINTTRDVEIRFRMSHPLSDFMTTLHQNGANDKALSKNVQRHLADDVITFRAAFPNDGQYGLDIYTRETMSADQQTEGEKHLLTHCCKYLINVKKR